MIVDYCMQVHNFFASTTLVTPAVPQTTTFFLFLDINKIYVDNLLIPCLIFDNDARAMKIIYSSQIGPTSALLMEGVWLGRTLRCIPMVR